MCTTLSTRALYLGSSARKSVVIQTRTISSASADLMILPPRQSTFVSECERASPSAVVLLRDIAVTAPSRWVVAELPRRRTGPGSGAGRPPRAARGVGASCPDRSQSAPLVRHGRRGFLRGLRVQVLATRRDRLEV